MYYHYVRTYVRTYVRHTIMYLVLAETFGDYIPKFSQFGDFISKFGQFGYSLILTLFRNIVKFWVY